MWGWLTSIVQGVATVADSQITQYTDRKRELRAAEYLIRAEFDRLMLDIVSVVRDPGRKALVRNLMKGFSQKRIPILMQHIQTVMEDE